MKASSQLGQPPPTSSLGFPPQVFLVRKVTRPDSGHLYAMKVLKKATLKGKSASLGRTQAGPIGGGPDCRVVEMMREVPLSSGASGRKQANPQLPLPLPLPKPSEGQYLEGSSGVQNA